jgi:hypothetical protein
MGHGGALEKQRNQPVPAGISGVIINRVVDELQLMMDVLHLIHVCGVPSRLVVIVSLHEGALLGQGLMAKCQWSDNHGCGVIHYG